MTVIKCVTSVINDGSIIASIISITKIAIALSRSTTANKKSIYLYIVGPFSKNEHPEGCSEVA